MDVNKVLKTAVHQYFCNFEGKSWTPPTWIRPCIGPCIICFGSIWSYNIC